MTTDVRDDERRDAPAKDEAAEPVVPPASPSASGSMAASPNAEAAALEAARIVSEIIDIDTPTGAVIAAAAAAGAAIEVHRSEQQEPGPTVRLSRDRILAALAADEAALAEARERGLHDARQPQRRASSPVIGRTEPGGPVPIIPRRARTEPGLPTPTDGEPVDDEPEEFDPVQIAAAAIGRLRRRAKTDLAELRGHYHRHDVLVVVLALIIIAAAGYAHNNMVTPPNVTFDHRGLTFQHSQAWLNPEPVPASPPRLLRETIPAAPPVEGKSDGLYHVEFTSTIDPAARIEVQIDKKPAWSNFVTGLDLDRRSRWGELYALDDSTVEDVEGHDWLRTAYRYAHAPQKGDVPRIDRAIELATKDKDQIYVVTLFGSPAELARMEQVVVPSLRVATNVGLQIEPQTNRLSRKNYPTAVGRAFESTVMVVVADVVDGRIKAKGGGSGVIVGGDGSVLTNFHVIHDKDGRLHDLFVIGRFAEPDHAPQLLCAGRPNRSKLQRDLDLALIKCDLDLDGRAWTPASGNGVWATLPEGRSVDIKMGQRLWVLGYPDVGGGGLTLSQGEVGGWTGVDGAVGKDYIKTDASITHGNSGGPVVDDQGRLVGIASAFRTKVTASGGIIETTQVGLVRPLAVASDLLAIATAGWTPREGRTDVEITPSAVEASTEGVRLSTKIVDLANEAPIAEALVMVLRPGVSSSDVDVNRLDDQVLSWGRTNTAGEVLLKQRVPVPGTYTVMVVARGYEPLIGMGPDALKLDANTPQDFDPWGKIWLRAR